MDSYVKTKNGRERIKAYTWDAAPLPILSFNKLVRNHKAVKYATDFMCLDTETAHDSEERAWIYQWAVKIKNIYIYGRTPDELIELLIRIAETYKLKDTKRIICYIHNAAYDIQYLKHYLRKYDPNTHFFVTDSHSVIICDCLGFRILCSYKLTNMSLNALAKNYATTYEKAVGEIDYSIVRYQDEELTEADWFYMFSDVAAQMDGIQGYLRTMDYRYAYTAPVTSTGFVRMSCRKESKKDSEWREEFVKGKLTYEMYNLCRWAFMGGVCICNCFYSGRTIREDEAHPLGLGHDDFTSSYPARQMLDYMPEGAPSWYGEIECMEEFEELLNEYCCIFELTLTNVHIRPGVTAPCIPSSKCIGLVAPVRINGKIVSARSLTMAVTEIDYKWITQQYTADNIQVNNLLIFKRGKAPEWFKNQIMKYFTAKSTLKHENPLLYGKSKNFLNSIYGMTATSIIREIYEADDDVIFSLKEFDNPKAKEEADKKQLSKYYASYNSFMPYQYACYTTAWARDALYTMIQTVGYENFLYCDTDSVFYIKTEENIKAMEAYQQQCKERAIQGGAYVGENYLGMPTPEPKIRAFRGLHAKCYAMEEFDKDKGDYDLKVVIAGIPKKSIYWENGEAKTITNAEELGSIDNLIDGFVFEHNGGTRCIYNEQLPEVININGHETQVSSSAVIENISKEISNTMWTIENMNLLKLQQEAI